MKINYGIIAVKKNSVTSNFEKYLFEDVLHFCGYEHEPREEDIRDLKYELQTNPEFGLVGNKDYVLAKAPKEVVQYYNLKLSE